MKKLILATLFLAVSSAVAFAADFNGKWTADIPSRQGGTMTTTFTLKVDGAKLTGTMSSQMGDAVAFGLLFLVLLVRPSGLFGRVLERKA